MLKRLWLLFWLGLAGILFGQWIFVAIAIAIAPFATLPLIGWVARGRKRIAPAPLPPPLPTAAQAAAYGERL